jgi:hypothetical protein
MMADQPLAKAVIHQPGVADSAGKAMPAGAAQRQRRVAAAVEEQQRLLAGAQRGVESGLDRSKVKARQAMGLNIITDISDATTGQIIGSVRNKGLASIIRDTWEILDTREAVVGVLMSSPYRLARP